MKKPIRTTTSKTTINVLYRCEPMGRARENGPHLADLRAFVEGCAGLPDEVLVSIQTGHLDEGGRQDVTLRVSYTHPEQTDGEVYITHTANGPEAT